MNDNDVDNENPVKGTGTEEDDEEDPLRRSCSSLTKVLVAFIQPVLICDAPLAKSPMSSVSALKSDSKTRTFSCVIFTNV